MHFYRECVNNSFSKISVGIMQIITLEEKEDYRMISQIHSLTPFALNRCLF